MSLFRAGVAREAEIGLRATCVFERTRTVRKGLGETRVVVRQPDPRAFIHQIGARGHHEARLELPRVTGAGLEFFRECLGEFAAAGNEFRLAALPASPNDGRVYDRVEVDSFHIFKSSPHPNEAFDVIVYLTTTGALTQNGVVLSAIQDQQAAFFEAVSGQYPFVTSWQPFMDSLADPNILPAGGYLPNYTEAWARLMAFGDKMANTPGLDMAAETSSLEADLTVIFQK